MTVVLKDMDTRKKLFHAAARIFAQKGFNKATVDEIAEAAEVAKGTIYYYFKGKEELFLFLMEEGLETLRQKIEGAIGENADTVAGLNEMVNVHIDFFEEYRDLCIILLSEAWGISERQERLQQMLDKYNAAVGKMIDRGIASKVIRPIEKGILCASLFGITAVVAQYFLRKKEPFQWEEVKAQVREVWLEGILTEGIPMRPAVGYKR